MQFRSLASAALAGAAVLVLAGCAQSAPVAKDASLQNSSAGTSATAKAADSDGAPAALAFNAGGLFAGNATPTFPAGDPGKVAVVAEAPLDKNIGGGELVFAYRNNTTAAIAHVDFTATATAGGKLVATGKSQGTVPAQVKPGEVGFGFIYFEDPSSIPDSGATYAYTASTNPADTSFYNTAPLKITQATNNGTSIVGAALNETGKELVGPIPVQTYCFDGNSLTKAVGGFADQTDDVPVGGQVTFTVSLLDTKCDTFATAASGYFK